MWIVAEATKGVKNCIWGLCTGIEQKLEVVLEQTLLFKAVNCTSFFNENFTLVCLA